MSRNGWIPWTGDPAANLTILTLLLFFGIFVLVVGGMIALPIIAVIGIVKFVHWYSRRPAPVSALRVEAQQRVIAANFPSPDQFFVAHMGRLLETLRCDRPAHSIYAAMMNVSVTLYEAEHFNNPLPPAPPRNTIEEGRFRDALLMHMHRSQDAPRTLATFSDTLLNAYLNIIGMLPALAKADADTFEKAENFKPFATFPLIDLLPDPGAVVETLVLSFFGNDFEELNLFGELRDRLHRNLHTASKLPYPAPAEKLVLPSQFKGSPREIVSTYLRNTPLQELFFAGVPFDFSDKQRYEHMHVVGGSGHGKTQLLQHIILSDLKRPDRPALIIIDSQGEMLAKLQRLALFAPTSALADKLVSVDPEDVDYPPALNIFAMPQSRMRHYSQAVKEQVEAGTIELFNYIFGAIAAELTSRQNTTFAYVSRLMLSIPGATIQTLRELFEDGALSIDQSPFASYIRSLDPTTQGFFENQFFTKTYSQTKSQIARRLYGVLQVPSFDRMFSSSENKLDMYDAMQSGKVVLVNTSKAMLKTEASALFGRYMIARVIAAAFERIAVPATERNPVFLIIDEAADYFDDNLEMMLSQARKFNVGILFAHQHLEQLSPALRASVAANTSIKLAGGVSDRDARALAADMRTTTEFIASMRKQERSTQFACYVRNHTDTAVRLDIPFGSVEAEPRMAAAEYRDVISTNHQWYAASASKAEPQKQEPSHPDASLYSKETPAAVADDDWRS